MIKKPKYIKLLEKKSGVMSIMTLNFINQNIDGFISSRSFTTVWSEGKMEPTDNKVKWLEKIYKTKQEFYLYLSICENLTSMVIYYRQEQENELTIFLTQLLKQFKNDTINK